MDDFTSYGNNFQEALDNLKNVLIRCQEINLALSHEKCKMLLTEGIVLGHHIYSKGIKVDPTKIEVIVGLPSQKTQKEVRILLGNASYYHHFIEKFTNIVAPMFKLLIKDVEFQWTESFQNDFEILKAKLLVEPILGALTGPFPFIYLLMLLIWR